MNNRSGGRRLSKVRENIRYFMNNRFGGRRLSKVRENIRYFIFHEYQIYLGRKARTDKEVTGETPGVI
jgi:hypothetical protein